MPVSLLPHKHSAALEVPADFKNGVSRGMRLMAAPVFWAAGFTGEGIVIGVIDTGIDGSHPDLAGKVIGAMDYVKDGALPGQFNPHGTHVSGTAVANGLVKGLAPGAKLRDYRVLDTDGSGSDDAVSQAIADAADQGCHIINMSLGSPTPYAPIHQAIQYAIQRGSIVICAAGNNGSGTISYPAAYPEAVSVGALQIQPNGVITRAYFSSTNNEVDLVTPGNGVYSTAPNGLYTTMSGTSMASPHASGFAALLAQRALSRLGKLPTEEALWEALKCSTIDLGVAGPDTNFGAGFLTFYPLMPRTKKVEVQIGSKTRTVTDGLLLQTHAGFGSEEPPVVTTDTLDVAPIQVASDTPGYQRTLTPPRFTHEPMTDAVGYNDATKTVSITRVYLPGMTD